MPKRGTDHTWQLIKIIGDGACYAKCRCGFRYCCSSIKSIKGVAIESTNNYYLYCPNCGARKKWISDNVITENPYHV